MPDVVLEAMAMSVAVIATRIAGVPRVIHHDENGLLVDPDDGEQMRRAISRLFTDESLRHRLAEAGQETVETEHSFAARMETVRGIYDELLPPAVIENPRMQTTPLA